MRNIAVFASGSGTNAENIIKYFSTSNTARVTLVLSNRREAFVLKRAAALKVKTFFFDRNDFYNTGKVLERLKEAETSFIVLAGFLWLVPDDILSEYGNRIVNIHPALLPSYGGQGMFGDRVHRAVIENGEKESGISIHYVNSRYDSGDIIFQARCAIAADDTPASLAEKVHALEYSNYPVVVKELIQKLP